MLRTILVSPIASNAADFQANKMLWGSQSTKQALIRRLYGRWGRIDESSAVQFAIC